MPSMTTEQLPPEINEERKLTTHYEIAPTMRVPENHWYPVLESCEAGRKPLGVERLGR